MNIGAASGSGGDGVERGTLEDAVFVFCDNESGHDLHLLLVGQFGPVS